MKLQSRIMKEIYFFYKIGMILWWLLLLIHDYFWNIRGLNNGKCREIRARLNNLKPGMAILIETRAKATKAITIKNKLGQRWTYADNYCSHNNGII